VEAYEAFPACKGLLLYRHGLFTFADDARTSYERHIAMIDRAEQAIAREVGDRRAFPALMPSMKTHENAARLGPVLRSVLADKGVSAIRHTIVAWRCTPDLLGYANSDVGRTLSERGPLTPDHILRTKEKALHLPLDLDYSDSARLHEQVEAATREYSEAYKAYFARNRARTGRPLKALDPLPRVIYAPDAGLFTIGLTRADAEIPADLAEHTVRVKGWAHEMSGYEALDETHLFDMEYWSLEQAKLGKRVEKPLAGQVAIITGAGGAIGRGVALQLARAGAHLALLDIDLDKARAAAETVHAVCGPVAEAISCDVTDERSVNEAFDHVARAFGGFDILVLNAGLAYGAPIRAIEKERLEHLLRVNLSFSVLQQGAERLVAQGTGGHVVLISTKNVFAPGKEFGAYSASKAAAHQMARVAALEFAEHAIRVNMVNPDAVFGHEGVASGLWSEIGPDRAKAHGVATDALPQFYQGRNLLKAQVTAEHVGNAVVFFATDQTPTTGASLPVDGGIPEAFPR
jgi:NAD(P)-dependent dehydrogenase (short-subunit alcohol dehydrogenase family)